MRRREGTIEIYEDDGSHYLCLLRARARDSGSYSCIASNIRGQVSCDWTLLVKSEYIPPGSLDSAGGKGDFISCTRSSSTAPPRCPTLETFSPHSGQGRSHCSRTVTLTSSSSTSPQNKLARPTPTRPELPFLGSPAVWVAPALTSVTTGSRTSTKYTRLK